MLSKLIVRLVVFRIYISGYIYSVLILSQEDNLIMMINITDQLLLLLNIICIYFLTGLITLGINLFTYLFKVSN